MTISKMYGTAVKIFPLSFSLPSLSGEGVPRHDGKSSNPSCREEVVFLKQRSFPAGDEIFLSPPALLEVMKKDHFRTFFMTKSSITKPFPMSLTTFSQQTKPFRS